MTIIDFMNDLPKPLRRIQNDVRNVKQKQMEGVVCSIRAQDSNISCQILQGKPFVEIVRKVLKDKHDLVLIPAEGKTRFKEQIFGNTSMLLCVNVHALYG